MHHPSATATEQTTCPRWTWVTTCTTCDLTGSTVSCLDEGRMLAAIHDDLHHRGTPTMSVTLTPPTIVGQAA